MTRNRGAHPADGCDRLRGWTPAEGPRGGRAPSALHGAAARIPAYAGRGRHRSRCGGRAAAGHASGGPAWRGYGVLPDPLHGDLAALRDQRPTRRGGIRPRRPGGRCSADHLSRWPGRGRPAVPASGEPPAGRSHPARVGRAHDRVPRLDRDRVRQPLLRAGPRARREAPDHADAALGGVVDSAHRGRGPGGLPGRRARPAEGWWGRLRGRRAGSRLLR